MGASSEVKQKDTSRRFEQKGKSGRTQTEGMSEEDARTRASVEEGTKGSLKRTSPFKEPEISNEERAMKKRSTYIPEIELSMWPRLVHLPGTSSNTEPQRARYQGIQQRIHRPWEPRIEKCDSYPVRNRACLPINRFITTEFGHLGVRNQKFSNEGQCPYGRQFCKIEHESNWMVSPAHSYASYFGHGRSYIPMPRECYSCHERQDYLLHGKRHCMGGAFDPQMIAAADRFRLQLSHHEQEVAKPMQRLKHPGENESQKKQGLTTYWPKISSDNPSNGHLKGQGVTSSSPTFEYISTSKTKDSQERPFNCTVCEKSFKRRSSLATHKFIHTDLKPHVCSECNKRFLRKSDLKKHGLMHSGKKPYECEKCGRRFSQSSNMLTHLRRHMGIRPFECKICSRSFFRKVDLKRHEGRHIAKTLKAKCETE